MKTYIKSLVTVLALSVLTHTAKSQHVLSLQEAISIAAEHNPGLQASRLEIEKSRQQKVIARSALLPMIQASAQINHFFQLTPFFGFGENSGGDKIPYSRFGGEDQLNTYISAVQPVFNPQAFPALKQAGLRIEESSLTAAAEKSATLFSVKRIYLQTLLLNERLSLQRESVRRNQRVLQDARSLFIQGKGLKVDTLRAYTAVKNLEPELIKLGLAIETSKLELKALLYVDSFQDITLSDSLFVVDDSTIPSEDEVYTAAKNANPTYRLLKLQEELSKQQVNIASAARMPTVSAVAQYQLQSQTNNLEYSNAHYPSASFVGLQLSLPIFNGFSNHARIKQANISRTQTALHVNYAYERLHAAVHSAVAGSNEAFARLQTTAAVEETAKLSYNITEYRYKRGVSSRLELADASLELSTAQSNFLEAVYDYMISRIVLQHLMGNVD
jgi:outer membrane protein TolC